MGGAGATSDVVDKVIDRLNIPEEELELTNQNGNSTVRNRINWARLYLVKSGLLDSKERGIWKLTDKGWSADLTEEEIEVIYKMVAQEARNSKPAQPIAIIKKVPVQALLTEEEESTQEEAHTERLLDIIQSLSPAGFERLCKRLLTECGFTNVVVIGKSGDNGIDGIGLLEINALVSFKVLFQCKKYKESVGSSEVRDFRGAMQGRADKGIILTTGRFSKEAKNEAIRDGVPSIELVDGEKLVDMFEKFQLGLIPKTIFDIDTSFFDEFR